jgi:hypothetical protein
LRQKKRLRNKVGCRAVVGPSRVNRGAGRREREVEAGTAMSGIVVRRDAAAVGFDDRAADGQAHTQTTLLGREESVIPLSESNREKQGSIGHCHVCQLKMANVIDAHSLPCLFFIWLVRQVRDENMAEPSPFALYSRIADAYERMRLIRITYQSEYCRGNDHRAYGLCPDTLNPLHAGRKSAIRIRQVKLFNNTVEQDN